MEPRQPQHVVCHRLARFDVAFRRRGHLLLLPQLPRHQRGGLRQHRRFERENLGPRHLRPLRQHQHGERDPDEPGHHRGREREDRQHHLPADGLVRRLRVPRGRRGVAQQPHRPQGLRGSGALRSIRRLHSRRQHLRRAAAVEHDPRRKRHRDSPRFRHQRRKDHRRRRGQVRQRRRGRGAELAHRREPAVVGRRRFERVLLLRQQLEQLDPLLRDLHDGRFGRHGDQHLPRQRRRFVRFGTLRHRDEPV